MQGAWLSNLQHQQVNGMFSQCHFLIMTYNLKFLNSLVDFTTSAVYNGLTAIGSFIRICTQPTNKKR